MPALTSTLSRKFQRSASRTFVKIDHAFSKVIWIYRNQDGTTIVEVMSAILIFAIIMVGGLNFFFLPQAIIARQKMKRLAISAAHQRMESLLALTYVQLTSSLNESGTSVSLGTVTGTRNSTITEVDDPADGLSGNDADGNLVDYKIIIVDISWSDGKSQKVSLTTKVSKFGKKN